MATFEDLKPRGHKAPVHLLPARSLRVISAALEDGDVKYARGNYWGGTKDWRDAYGGAGLRHFLSFTDLKESDYSFDNGVHHLAAAAASAIIGICHATDEIGRPLDYTPSHNVVAHRILRGIQPLPENPCQALLEAIERMRGIMEQRGEEILI